MNRFEVWGVVLIVAAALAIALQVRYWRAGRINTAQLATAVLARGGFLVLGVIYATELIDRWPRAPFVGLAIVGLGIVLHLATNIITNLTRREE